MDHQGFPHHRSSGPHDPIDLNFSRLSDSLSFNLSLFHLAGNGLQRQPHLRYSPLIMAITIFMWTPRSPSSPISSHHSIHPSVWSGLLGIELGFVDFGIFNQRDVSLSWMLRLVSLPIGLISWLLCFVGELIPVRHNSGENGTETRYPFI